MMTAVFIDVDWTLTDFNRKIGSRVVHVLERLVERGLLVSLASATAYPIAYGLARYLPSSGIVVAENGGVVGFDNTFYVLGRIDKERVIRVAMEELECCLEDSWQNMFRLVDIAFVVKKGVDPSVAVSRARSVFGKLGFEVMYSGVAVHVHPPGINKGFGVRKVLELMGKTPDRIIAIGDSEVDIDMFEVADFTACPSHAPEEVKRRADYVASKPYSDGFIEIAEKFLLP